MKLLSFSVFVGMIASAFQQDCTIQSLTTLIETNGARDGTYNYIINIGSKNQCNYKINLSSNLAATFINAQTPNAPNNNMVFSHYVVKGVKLGDVVTWTASSGSYTSPKYSVQFPHDNKTTKIIAVGDWADVFNSSQANSNPPASNGMGPMTLNYLANKRDTSKDDIFLFAGDLAYDLHQKIRTTNAKDYGAWGDSWMNKIMGITSKVPFEMGWGNHEAMEGYPFKNFYQRFYFPNQDTNPQVNWYSIDVNNVHILTINSNIIAPQFDKTYANQTDNLTAWIKQDLAASKKRSKWVILYLHSPLYCSYPTSTSDNRCTTTAQSVRNYLEPLVNGTVDLIVNAHLHIYERFLPAYGGRSYMDGVNAKATVYNNPIAPVNVLCGHAGNAEGIGNTYNSTDPSIVVNNNPGICEIVADDKQLTINMIAGNRNNTNADFTTQDSFTIVKSNGNSGNNGAATNGKKKRKNRKLK